MSFIIKEFPDVFPNEFIQALGNIDQEDVDAKLKIMNHIMRKVADYERKYTLQFVAFHMNEMIIFREIDM